MKWHTRISIPAVVLILVFGFCSELQGQTFPFRSYSIEKGLSEAVIHDLMQDHNGYLWIATSYGLNRFDGINFKNYFTDDGLFENRIQSLYQDEENRIWIGTSAGINIMEDDSIRTYRPLKPLESSTILDIFEDSMGDFWFATDGEGVWHLDQKDNLTQYLSIHGLSGDRVRKVAEGPDGTLWFATREGLTQLSNGNFRTYTTRHGLPDEKLRDLVVDADGSLWIATRGGLSHFKDGSFENFTEPDGLINNRIQALSIAGDGSIWLGTEEGVSHFIDGAFENFTVSEGLSNDIVHSTLIDREGNIWFGTFGGGINLFLGKQFENYTVEEGLPNNVITDVTQDRAGVHWVTTYGGGIARLDGNEVQTYSAKDGLVDNKVYSVIVDRNNRLLVGTRWGLSIFDEDRNTFFNFDEHELPYRKIRALLEPGFGAPDYWLGTYGEGVLFFSDNVFHSLDEEDGLANNTVLSIQETDDGAIWFATYGGVSRYADGAFENYTIQDGLPNNGVLDILEDRNGNLWFSTFGGIARFENGAFEAITTADGLPDEVCYFIEQDDRGIFWIGTNKGVVRFDYDRYRKPEAAEKLPAFKLITQNQGIVANEMNAGASFKDRDGNLWFGSVGGVTKLIPSMEKINRAPPILHIESVRVSGEEVSPRPSLEIGSDNHNITFEFIGISFNAPEHVTYEYRLRNTGEGWQTTTDRSVRYSALRPGEYRFEVRARNNDGFWSTETTRLDLTVLAPFWMQWWFIVLVLLALVGIILFIYNYYRVRKMMELERMRVRIASDLHDDVGSALTEIALQSDFLQTVHVDNDLQESLKQIGTQSRKIVSSLDDIVWSIDARNDTLGDLTDRMQDYANNVLPNKEVHYNFEALDMNEKLHVPVKENLYLIFKESVNNIAKHSNAERVDITLATRNAGFVFVIRDNGDTSRNGRRSGQGLRNMKMRAKRIGAEVYFNNENGFEVRVEGTEI